MAFESIDDAKSMGRVEPFNAVRVPCAGNLLESFESGPLPLLLLLVLGRVFALVEQQLGFVPLLARNRESNEGVFADAQQLFLAVEAVFQAPQFRAARLHEQVQTAAIGQFVSPLTLGRSEEHTSELQSLMRISSAVFCFKNNKPVYLKPCNNKQT